MAQQRPPPPPSKSQFKPIEIEPALLEVPARSIPPQSREDQLLLEKRWLDIPAEAFDEDPERWDGMS